MLVLFFKNFSIGFNFEVLCCYPLGISVFCYPSRQVIVLLVLGFVNLILA